MVRFLARGMAGWAETVRATVRAHRGVAGVTLVYLAGFTLLGLRLRSPLTLPYLAVVATLVLLVARLDRRFELGGPLLWALSTWGFAHMAGGVVPLDGDRTLYNLWLVDGWLRYDQVVHAFGFGSATFACGRILSGWLPGGRISPGPAVVVLLAGMGVAALNEIVEFAATLALPATNVGGYQNTGWDLVFDLGGALIATAWLLRSSTRSPAYDGAGRRCTDTAYPPADHGWRSQVAHRSAISSPAASHIPS